MPLAQTSISVCKTMAQQLSSIFIGAVWQWQTRFAHLWTDKFLFLRVVMPQHKYVRCSFWKNALRSPRNTLYDLLWPVNTESVFLLSLQHSHQRHNARVIISIYYRLSTWCRSSSMSAHQFHFPVHHALKTIITGYLSWTLTKQIRNSNATPTQCVCLKRVVARLVKKGREQTVSLYITVTWSVTMARRRQWNKPVSCTLISQCPAVYMQSRNLGMCDTMAQPSIK